MDLPGYCVNFVLNSSLYSVKTQHFSCTVVASHLQLWCNYKKSNLDRQPKVILAKKNLWEQASIHKFSVSKHDWLTPVLIAKDGCFFP